MAPSDLCGQVADVIKKALLGDAALPWVREVDVEVRKSQRMIENPNA